MSYGWVCRECREWRKRSVPLDSPESTTIDFDPETVVLLPAGREVFEEGEFSECKAEGELVGSIEGHRIDDIVLAIIL